MLIWMSQFNTHPGGHFRMNFCIRFTFGNRMHWQRLVNNPAFLLKAAFIESSFPLKAASH